MKYIILVTLSVSILLLGCKKIEESKEKNLIGVWQVVPMMEYITKTWEFGEDNLFLRKCLRDDSTFIDTGEYHVNLKYSRYYLEISNFTLNSGEEHLGGTYLILNKKKDMLFIQRVELANGQANAAFLRKEFIKL